MGTSPVPADLRQLFDNQVVARWIHHPANKRPPSTLTFYSTGKMNSPDGDDTWAFVNGRLTLSWKNAKRPAGTGALLASRVTMG